MTNAFFGILENTNLNGPDDTDTYKTALEVKMYGETSPGSGIPKRPFGGFRNNGWFTGDPRNAGTTWDPDVNNAYAAGRKFTYVNDSLVPNAQDGTVWGKVASGTYDDWFKAAFAIVAADSRWTSTNPFHYSYHHEQSVTSEGGGNLAGTPEDYVNAFHRVAYLLWQNGSWHASQGGNIVLCCIADGSQFVASGVYGSGKSSYPVELTNPNQPSTTAAYNYASTVAQTTTISGRLLTFYRNKYGASFSATQTKYADFVGGDLYSGLHGVHTWADLAVNGAAAFAADVGCPWMTGETGCATSASSAKNVGVYSAENFAADMLTQASQTGATGIGPGQLYGINYTSRVASGGDYTMDATPSIQTAWKNTVTSVFFNRQVGVNVQPPDPPTSVTTGAITNTSIVVNWNAGTAHTNPIGSYQVEVRVSGSGNTGWANFGSTASGLTQTITGLTKGTSYDFKVQAIDNAGNPGSFSSVTATATTTGSGVTPPSIPANFRETADLYNEIDLAWDASTAGTNPIAHYQVSEATLGIVGTPTTTSIQVTGLSPSTGYIFTVSCWDNTGVTSGESSALDVTTPAKPHGGDQQVAITNPTPNEVFTSSATIQVRTTVTPGTYSISSVTVQVNSSSAIAMNNNPAGTDFWTKQVTLSNGSNTIVVTATDSTGAPVSATVLCSFGQNTAPTFTILNPTGVDEVITTQQMTVSIDWEDTDGIDESSVQVSTDGVNWQNMTYNPPAASSGSIAPAEGG
jgi:hypothetical protein